jgi:hypothetical protein
MNRKARLQLSLIINGYNARTVELIQQVENWQLALIAPKNFDSADVDNYVKRLELSFESLCTSMEELGVVTPGELTVFQFYTKLTYFEKKKLNQKGRR